MTEMESNHEFHDNEGTLFPLCVMLEVAFASLFGYNYGIHFFTQFKIYQLILISKRKAKKQINSPDSKTFND